MKTTCKKSWPENLFQVVNLTFDPCFKVNGGVLMLKRPSISLIIGAKASECKNSP